MRHEFGFPGDREHTRGLYNERGRRSRLRIPLSAVEEADFSERAALRDNRPKMLAELAKHQPDNGGMYTDQEAGGRVILQLTAPLSNDQKDAIRAASGYPARIDFRQVKHSLTQLKDAYQRVTLRSAKARSRQIVDAAMDERENKVWLGTKDMSAANVAGIHKDFPGEIYDVRKAKIGTEEDSALSSPGQMKAGVQITGAGQPGPCTSGFPARVLGLSDTWGFLTAAHCATQVGSTWKHNGRTIGVTHRTTFGQPGGALADAALIRFTGPQGIRSNLKQIESGIYTTTSRQSKTADKIGDDVCKFGFAWPFENAPEESCGKISLTNWSEFGAGGIELREIRLATYSSINGDSGGPVYLGGMAMGLHRGRLRDEDAPLVSWAKYSHIENAEIEVLGSTLTDIQAVHLGNGNSSLCMDADTSPDGQTGDGKKIMQWPCHSGSNQEWRLIPRPEGSEYYELRNNFDGFRCADVGGAALNDGAGIIQWTCHGGNNQRYDLRWESSWTNWAVTVRPGHIPNNTKCVEVPGASLSAGTQLVQWECNNGLWQRWNF